MNQGATNSTSEMNLELRQKILSCLFPYLLEQSKIAQSRRTTLSAKIKNDLSPVCDVDYLNQIAFGLCVKKLCPNDKLIAEEEIDADLQVRLLSENQEYVSGAMQVADGIAKSVGTDSCGGQWYLDPIDGTKGFMDGMVFSIGAAFTENGVCKLSGIACANLQDVVHQKSPSLWIAGNVSARNVPRRDQDGDPESITLAISRKHRSSSLVNYLNSKLNVRLVELDSMAKYVCVASGYCDAYIREGGQCGNGEDMIWDHLPGIHLIRDYGGVVADAEGMPPDYSNSDGTNRIRFKKFLIAAKDEAVCNIVSAALENR